LSAALSLPLFERGDTEARFAKFHADNPHIYQRLVSLARRAKAAGRRRLGIRVLWERMRWELEVETLRADGAPKLNNNYTGKYVRLIQRLEPDLREFFETRGAP
jgi:hypothetical protein